MTILIAMLIPTLAYALAACLLLAAIEHRDARRTRRLETRRADRETAARLAEEEERRERGRDVIRFAERFNAGRGA